jgi:hypothetical protein
VVRPQDVLLAADTKGRWSSCYSCTGGLGDVTLKVSVTERDRERFLSRSADVTGGKLKIMADNPYEIYGNVYKVYTNGIWY